LSARINPSDLETAQAAITGGEDMDVVAKRVGIARQPCTLPGCASTRPCPTNRDELNDRHRSVHDPFRQLDVPSIFN
jgi:hypothetical protein